MCARKEVKIRGDTVDMGNKTYKQRGNLNVYKDATFEVKERNRYDRGNSPGPTVLLSRPYQKVKGKLLGSKFL